MLGNLMLMYVQAEQLDQSETFVFGRMAPITRAIYEQFQTVTTSGAIDYKLAGYITLVVVFILAAVVYKLGFAKQLPNWQNVIIYILLFLGSIMLTFFAFFLPIVEGLIVATLVLVIYKLRMWQERRHANLEK